MAKVLYFDCFCGASGDMILGALLDAGLPIEELRGALGSLMVEGCDVAVGRVVRTGLAAAQFRVLEQTSASTATSGADRQPAGANALAPGPHGHRALKDILALIERSALSGGGKRRAAELFQRIAEVEATVHQVPLDRVHLHEVGALDSIIDIVGTVFAMEWLHIDRVVSSALNVGGGMVRAEHGLLPVPAPATAELLKGVPAYSSGVQAELLTPTGALLVTAFATSYGPLPAMRVRQVGYGAGERELSQTPNLLRVLIGDEEGGPADVEQVVVIECEIDDMNPQIFGVLMDRLYEAGALEVFYAPVQMKKGRPGTLVTVLASVQQQAALRAIIFRETTTLGVRYQVMERELLQRETIWVRTPLGPVRFKVARRGSTIMNAAPEFDDCARLASARGLPVKDVQAIVTRAYLESRQREGA